TGVSTGIRAVNPANSEEIPVWVADYVLGNYGTGAIMAVPAHDERDFSFAKKYELPVREVIRPDVKASVHTALAEAYIGDGALVNSGTFTGMRSEEAKGVITKHVSGKMTVTYKLRDWVFSRQRYWGEPIPVVFCAQCGTVPVPEDQLPVVLPEAEKYQPTDSGESPLASIAEWVNTNCPRCGGAAKRETDVMPNWAGSSWYFLRYCDPHNDRALADTGKLASWMPVDWYNGGMEHTTLHLLYSRFWNLFLHDIGAVPMAEPYAKRTSHGMILAANGEKMSKSRGNVVNPDTIIAQYGADTVRVYEMFIGPFDQAVPWSENGLVGCRRFLEKLWGARERVEARPAGNQCTSTDRLLHRTIKKVSEDIEAMRFNTAIAAMMEYVNDLVQRERIAYFDFVTFLALLAPFAPHLCEELHAELEAGSGGEQAGHSIFAHPWPQYDPALIVETEVELVVQVNGKLRAILRVSTDITEADATARALAELNVIKQLAGAQPKKIVFVPGRLINVVV
ncbi:MAG: class I tRNA ligase family protein, partial [bacterium]|nr:class I tRNA ligase family protein [bacterium]